MNREWVDRTALVAPFFALAMLCCHHDRPGTFVLPSSPEAEVLRIDTVQGLTNLEHRYAIYGDGRVESVWTNRDGSSFNSQYIYLPHLEVVALIRGLVDAGLLDRNEADLHREVVQLGFSTPNVEDASTRRLTVYLDSYTTTEGSTKAPFVYVIRSRSTHLLVYLMRNRNVEPPPALAAYDNLLRTVDQLFSQ